MRRATTEQSRWAEGAPKVVMALNKAGWPCHYEEIRFTVGGWQENVIVFDGRRPPLDVLVKAGEVCDIGDLMALLGGYVADVQESEHGE